MISKLQLLLSICLLLGLSTLHAQGTEDGRFWGILGAKYKIDKHWSLSFNNVVRIKDDIGSYRDFFVEPAIAYQINSNLSAKASYRCTFIPQDGQDWHWIFLDFNMKFPLADSPIFLTSRTRYHHGFDINDFEDGDFLREHLAIRYKAGKFTPFMAIGMFYRVNNINQIQVMRYEIGTSWKFAKNWNLTAYYRRQDNVRGGFPFDDFRGRFNVPVVGLTYSIPKKAKE